MNTEAAPFESTGPVEEEYPTSLDAQPNPAASATSLSENEPAAGRFEFAADAAEVMGETDASGPADDEEDSYF